MTKPLVTIYGPVFRNIDNGKLIDMTTYDQFSEIVEEYRALGYEIKCKSNEILWYSENKENDVRKGWTPYIPRTLYNIVVEFEND